MTITIGSGHGQLLGFSAGTYPSSPVYLGAYPNYISDTIANYNAQPLVINGNSLYTYTYPLNSGFTNFTILSTQPTSPPLGSSINGIVVRCNLVDNMVTFPTDVLDIVPINSSFGSNIVYQFRSFILHIL
jgi:hypothetical protein